MCYYLLVYTFFHTGQITAEPELAYGGYKGTLLMGAFQGLSNDIEGSVYVVNGTALLVEGFSYDGMIPGK